MARVVGIDLGTSFSVVAAFDETGRPFIVPNKDDEKLTPSCVTRTGESSMEVGEYARRQWGNKPGSAAARFKRDMGTSTKFSIDGMQFTPTELSTLVLKKLVADTTAHLGSIDEVVVTIPANFAHEAREATLSAAKAAGLNVKYIINEPTAAALYYAYKNGGRLSGTYAVYDLGGGTFDISIIRVKDRDVEVISSNGISKLGGDDFDAALQRLVAVKYQKQTGKTLSPDEFTKNNAEEQKKSLSLRKQVTIKCERQLVDIRRDEFEEAISSLVAQTEMLCEATLDEANIGPGDVDGVILAGGSTRVPLVHDAVTRVFGQEPIATENPDEIVALGAAIYAAYKTDRTLLSPAQRSTIGRMKVSETTGKYFGTISLGMNTRRKEMEAVNNILISKGEKIPCSVTEPFFTVFEGQRAVNCQVTESASMETDPRFVKVIWRGELDLGEGRAAEQRIDVTFSYDENQIMKCSFTDVTRGQKTEVDLTLANASASNSGVIDKFLVE